ncbi:ABC transporter permease subunit [Pedobacter vanadiisoli]|uniref:ABC transporter permease subunit n=1 Tax=Pedobacter vanadiisoli TaxID=1761975 RepID=A0ABW5MG41_9SPHI
MQLLKTIFLFELRLLARQKFILLLISFFFLTGIYSIYYGYHFTEKQLATIDSLENGYQKKYKEIEAAFSADTTTADGKILFNQAGIPSVIEYKNPLNAVYKPQSISILSIGQSDLQPYYDVITRRRNFMQGSNAEISNPELLASGNFDLAYVIIFLLPILAIALSYNTWSKEKEQQTDKLLSLQGIYFGKIIGYKLVFRFLLVGLMVWLLSIIGFISSASLIPFDLGAAVFWLLITSAYLFFWFAVTFFILRLGKSSVHNALYLLGLWCTLLILLPALCNTVVRLYYPIPLKTGAAVALRENSEAIWAIPPKLLIDTFYLNNPKYKPLREAADTSETSNKRFAAYYDLLGRRMTRAIENYNRYPAAQNEANLCLSWFNPAIKTQYLLNRVAGTGLNDYLSYQRQVNDFQKTWVDFMTGYIISDKKLSLNDLKDLPQFKLKYSKNKYREIVTSILYLSGISFCIMFLSRKIIVKI